MPPFNQPWADTITDLSPVSALKSGSEALSGDWAGAGDAALGPVDEVAGWLGNTAAGNQPDGSGGVEPNPDANDGAGPDTVPEGENSDPDIPWPTGGGGASGGGGGGGGGIGTAITLGLFGIIAMAVAWALDSVGGVVGDD